MLPKKQSRAECTTQLVIENFWLWQSFSNISETILRDHHLRYSQTAKGWNAFSQSQNSAGEKHNVRKRLETLKFFYLFEAVKVYALEDALSMTPNVKEDAIVNDIEVYYSLIEKKFTRTCWRSVIWCYCQHHAGCMVIEYQEASHAEKVGSHIRNVTQSISSQWKICVPRKSGPIILKHGCDLKLFGHFKSEKTMSRLISFFWRQKGWDLYRYVNWCVMTQQSKNLNQGKLKNADMF